MYADRQDGCTVDLHVTKDRIDRQYVATGADRQIAAEQYVDKEVVANMLSDRLKMNRVKTDRLKTCRV